MINIADIKLNRMDKGHYKANLSGYRRAKPGQIDLTREKITEVARELKYFDNTTKLPSSEIDTDMKYWHRLSFFWLADYIKLDLNSSFWSGRDYGEIKAPELELNAMVVAGNNTPLYDNKSNIIWEGYMAENDLWKLFSQGINSPYTIKDLHLTPYGNFIVRYEDASMLDTKLLINSALLFGIIYNKSLVEFTL